MPAGSNAYNSLWQVRTDAWSALEESNAQLAPAGDQVVSTTYVTPYPPGFPVLVPGQLFSPQILAFMRSLDTPEVHGYRADLGYRVHVDKALEIAATTRPAPPPDPIGPAPASAAPASATAAAPSTSPDAP